jgi:protoporphyrinogen oxidase
VEAVRRTGSGWRVRAGGRDRDYDHVVLAMPILDALGYFEDVPREVQEALHGLRYNALRLGFVAVNNESLMDKSAIYIPDPTVLPHRVCYMGFFSPNVVRPGTSSLVAETTTPPGGEIDRLSDAAFVERLIDDLDRVGIIHKQDVIVSDTRRIAYAYPVYDRDYGKNVATLRQYFQSLGIDQLGRFAEFDYINSDECIHRAMNLAKRLNAL